MAGRYVYVKAPKRNDISQQDRGHWSDKKKNEALAFFVANGSLTETSRECQVPLPTLHKWKASEWWKDRVQAIQNEEYDKLDVKLSKALDKALDQVMDRISNGDHIYDPRTGQIRQIPAKLRDVSNAFNSIMDKRQLVRKQPTKIIEQQSTATQLQNLAEQFAAFVSGKQKVEKVDELTLEFIEGETVEQDEDGTYRVIDTGVDDAVYDEWQEGLQEGTELGAQEETQQGEGSIPEKHSESNSG